MSMIKEIEENKCQFFVANLTIVTCTVLSILLAADIISPFTGFVFLVMSFIFIIKINRAINADHLLDNIILK